jgi:predicted nucleic acid-binding protein
VIFLDASGYIAAVLEKDGHHAAARSVWDRLRREGTRLLTTDRVVGEILNTLGRRASPAFAVAAGRDLFGSKVLEILRPGPLQELDALDVIEDAAKRLPAIQVPGFVDALSFLAMRARGVDSAFTFDRDHFVPAKFTVIP